MGLNSTIAERIARFRSAPPKSRSERDRSPARFWWQGGSSSKAARGAAPPNGGRRGAENTPSPPEPEATQRATRGVTPPMSGAAAKPPSPMKMQAEAHRRRDALQELHHQEPPVMAHASPSPPRSSPAAHAQAASADPSAELMARLAGAHPKLHSALLSMYPGGRLPPSALAKVKEQLGQQDAGGPGPSSASPTPSPPRASQLLSRGDMSVRIDAGRRIHDVHGSPALLTGRRPGGSPTRESPTKPRPLEDSMRSSGSPPFQLYRPSSRHAATNASASGGMPASPARRSASGTAGGRRFAPNRSSEGGGFPGAGLLQPPEGSWRTEGGSIVMPSGEIFWESDADLQARLSARAQELAAQVQGQGASCQQQLQFAPHHVQPLRYAQQPASAESTPLRSASPPKDASPATDGTNVGETVVLESHDFDFDDVEELLPVEEIGREEAEAVGKAMRGVVSEHPGPFSPSLSEPSPPPSDLRRFDAGSPSRVLPSVQTGRNRADAALPAGCESPDSPNSRAAPPLRELAARKSAQLRRSLALLPADERGVLESQQVVDAIRSLDPSLERSELKALQARLGPRTSSPAVFRLLSEAEPGRPSVGSSKRVTTPVDSRTRVETRPSLSSFGQASTESAKLLDKMASQVSLSRAEAREAQVTKAIKDDLARMDLPALCAFLGLKDPGVIDRDELPPFLREVWLATRASDAAEDAGAPRICDESVPDNTIPPEALSELGEQVERLKTFVLRQAHESLDSRMADIEACAKAPTAGVQPDHEVSALLDERHAGASPGTAAVQDSRYSPWLDTSSLVRADVTSAHLPRAMQAESGRQSANASELAGLHAVYSMAERHAAVRGSLSLADPSSILEAVQSCTATIDGTISNYLQRTTDAAPARGGR
eukprot:jgi/Tetstr1/456224/TSEL_042987.t1